MNTASHAIYAFMNGEETHLKVYEMEHPDVLLWAVWTIQQYAKMVSREVAKAKYGTLLKDIICAILAEIINLLLNLIKIKIDGLEQKKTIDVNSVREKHI